MSSTKILKPEMVKMRAMGEEIVLATGCFDVLHRGHVELLEYAYHRWPSMQLWVGLNSDTAVRSLKGDTRPVNDYQSRAVVMAALQYVDRVFEIDHIRVDAAIRTVCPFVWLKGGDYTVESLNQDEVKAAKQVGAFISIHPITHGFSTTNVLKALEKLVGVQQ